MRIYLAGLGPMRHYPLFNFPEFTVATARIRELGHEVFSPAEDDLRNGFDPVTGKFADGTFRLREVMAVDLQWICRNAEAVVVLHGWQHSLGSLAEVHAARALGLPVYGLNDFILGRLHEVEV